MLLDIRLGTESGLTPADRRRRREPRPAIVVLTAYDYPQYAEAALRLGAAGFVLKTAPMAELLDAIRRAAGGGLAFGVRPRAVRPGPAVAPGARRGRAWSSRVAPTTRSAAALGIGAKTVETHLARLFERFGDRLAHGARDPSAARGLARAAAGVTL